MGSIQALTEADHHGVAIRIVLDPREAQDIPLAKALAMTSATAAISRSPAFQSATRARAVVSAGPARAPDVHATASRTAAAILVTL